MIKKYHRSRKPLPSMPPRPGISLKGKASKGSDIQKRFFERIGSRQQFQQLFEHLHGIYFFLKDTRSRLIAASLPIVERLGMKDERAIVGTTDYDYFPPEIADGFVRDDKWVISTGKPLINRLEIWINEQGILDWFVTNKLPVRAADTGQIIGVMGTVQSYEGRKQALLPYSQICNVVDYIQRKHREPITVADLASIAGLSPRQLHRRFQQVFRMSIQKFLIKTRIQSACDALARSNRQICEIAQDYGFCDQSAFTVQFRQHTGLTPLQFRQRYLRR